MKQGWRSPATEWSLCAAGASIGIQNRVKYSSTNQVAKHDRPCGAEVETGFCFDWLCAAESSLLSTNSPAATAKDAHRTKRRRLEDNFLQDSSDSDFDSATSESSQGSSSSDEDEQAGGGEPKVGT